MLHSLNAVESPTFRPGCNYLPGMNPFGLSEPPRWFLEELWTYDPCLVIFPSVEESVYRLARRVEHGSPLFSFLKNRPDTKVFVQHRLVPVTSILPSGMVAWSPLLLRDLAERDIRRSGGYKRAADYLDTVDAVATARTDRMSAEEAETRARSAWRGMKWTNGETVDLGSRRIHNGRMSRPNGPRPTGVPAYRPQTAPDFQGGLFTGPDPVLHETKPYREADAVAVPMTHRSVILTAAS